MIKETIVLEDKVSAAARKAAANVARLEANLRKADKAAAAVLKQELTAEKLKKRAVDRVLRDQQRAAKAAEKTSAAATKSERKIIGERVRSSKKRGTLARREELQDDRIKTSTLGIIGTILGIGAAAAAAAVSVAKLGVSFTHAASEALDTRRGAEGLFAALTGGRGKQAVEAVDRLGEQLGLSLGEAREQFDKFRTAGLDNKQTAQLMKLRADIVAVTGSAERGDEAVEKVLAAKKEGRSVKEQMDALAKSAGTLGQGFDAAKNKVQTLGGALKTIKDAPARFLDSFVKQPQVAESMDKLGQSISKTLGKLMESPAAAKALAMVTNGFEIMMSIVSALIPLVVPFFEGIVGAAEPVADVLAPIGKAIANAFKDADKVEMVATAFKVLGAAVVIAGIALGVAVGIVGVVVASLLAVPVAIAAAVLGLAKLASAAKEKLAEWRDAGVQAVQGLIDGIKSKVSSAVAAAKQLASDVSGAIKSALKIGSPSKLMEDYGEFTVAGFNKGIENMSPAAQDSMSSMAPSGSPRPAAAPVASGGKSFTLQLSVSAQPGATKQDGENLASGIIPIIRKEIDSYLAGAA